MIIDIENSPDALAAFLRVPDVVYQGDDRYTRTSPQKTLRWLQGPKFHDRHKAWIACDDDRPVARIVARYSPTLLDDNGVPYGSLGDFEAINDQPLISELVATGSTWLRQQGCQNIVGPISGDTWHSYRFNAGPWDDEPYLMEPYHPRYYAKAWEACGAEITMSYFSTVVHDISAAAEQLRSHHQQATQAGYRFRPFDKTQFDDELALLHQLSSEAFAGNYLYDPIALSDFRELYTGVESLLDSELVRFALATDGEVVGFLFALVDYYQAVRAMRGQQTLWAKAAFLWNRRRADAVNLKSLAVLESHRRNCVGAALTYEIYQQAISKGFRRANLCLMREGNPSGKLDGGIGRVMRRYHLYRLPLEVGS